MFTFSQEERNSKQEHATHSAEARHFLTALFAEKDERHFLTLGSRFQNDYLHTASLEEFISEADRRTQKKQNVYYALGLHAEELPPDKKGEVKDVIAITSLWLDLDVKHAVHKKEKNLPPTREDGRKVIALFPIPPTFLIWSGHGWQALWLLREHWIFDSDEERNKAQALLARFQRYFIIEARERWQWHVDATHNLDRVLRPPGTTNWKDKEHPIRSELIETTDVRVNVSDIIDTLHELEAHSDAQQKNFYSNSNGRASKYIGPLVFKAHASPPADKFEALFTNEPRFALSWKCEREDLDDKSTSGHALSIADFAAMSEWTPQEIVDLLIAFDRKRNNRQKGEGLID